MNTNTALQTALRLALVANITACIDMDADFGDDAQVLSEESLGQTEQAIGSCNYRLAAAAITKQIVSIDEPTSILVELVTITDKPYKMNVTSMTHPAGFNLLSLGTTSCTDTGTGWKCRHQGTIVNSWATSGTGSYSMNFTPVADAGSGCANGSSQRVDFWLTTESFSVFTADVNGTEAIMYTAWQYGGQAFGLEEGRYEFTGNLAAINDVLSSIRVTPGWQVTLYEHSNFTGRQLTLTADSSFVGDFNDLTSSMWIRRR